MERKRTASVRSMPKAFEEAQVRVKSLFDRKVFFNLGP
jgi:hypothetical protein